MEIVGHDVLRREGILHAGIYGEMLTRLRSDHRGITRAYELEPSDDRIGDLDEVTFDAAVSARDALDRVREGGGWSPTD